jgi:hypothetical protein
MYFDKHVVEFDKKAAKADFDKARQATLVKTAKLKALRLAKEAEADAAAALKPKKAKKAAAKRKLPAFERE